MGVGGAPVQGHSPLSEGSGLSAKPVEAESFGGPLADIVHFTNLIYLTFYGHNKETANLPTSLLFQGGATGGF